MPVLWQDGFNGRDFPRDHPRIGWDRRRGLLPNVTASSAAEGFPVLNGRDPRTDNWWKPTAIPAWWQITFTSPVLLSWAAIAGHNLATNGNRIRLRVPQLIDDTLDRTLPGTEAYEPTDNSPILWLFAPISVSRIRFDMTNFGTPPRIATLQCGRIMEFPQKADYVGGAGLREYVQTQYFSNQTAGGNFVGRRIKRVSFAPEMTVQHMPEAFMASDFNGFRQHARSEPFFIADRPGTHPESVVYAWLQGEVMPTRDLSNAAVSRSVTLQMQAERDD